MVKKSGISYLKNNKITVLVIDVDISVEFMIFWMGILERLLNSCINDSLSFFVESLIK